MKASLKIALAVTLALAMASCSAQKRAERRVRRAVIECPEMLRVKALPIDTVIAAPAFADCVGVRLPALLAGDTVYAATDHGTFVVSASQSDSTLRVGFVSVQQKIHYQDTVRYAQVVINPKPDKQASSGALWLAWVLVFAAAAAAAALLAWAIKSFIKHHWH